MLFRLVLTGVAACAIAGCHSYHPYCNSCGPYPGHQPSQVYQPPTVVPYQGQPGVPSGGVVPGGVAPGSVTPNGGDAPLHNPSPSASNPNSRGDNLAPNDYDDDLSGTNSQFNIETENIAAAETAAVEPDPVDDSADEVTSVAEEQSLEDEFVPPVPFKPASSRAISADTPPKATAARPNPYLYDNDPGDFNGDGVEERYEWLRGVINFDEKQRQWRITYNADPTDQDDKYGGTFTLSNDDLLYKIGLIPDDVVLIDGRVDIENTDLSGKPTYRVEDVERLKPETNPASK